MQFLYPFFQTFQSHQWPSPFDQQLQSNKFMSLYFSDFFNFLSFIFFIYFYFFKFYFYLFLFICLFIYFGDVGELQYIQVEGKHKQSPMACRK